MTDGAPLRILIPVLGFGRTGGNRVLAELANAWIRAGHEVAFACPSTSAPPYFRTEAPIFWLGPGGASADAPVGSGQTGLDNVRRVLGGVKRLHPAFDVVLANHSLTPWSVFLAGVPRAKRFYYIQALESEYYAMERKPLLWALSSASYAIPFTQIANASIYRHPFLRPAAILPFGIDLGVFRSREQTPRPPNASLTIGCIGRSEPQKGTPYVLKAFERLYKRDQRHRLLIAYGNLPAGWSHPGASVVQPGNDTELAAFYRSLDVLVAAGTVQHGAPHYPALEALASGVALVTTGFMPATADNAWIVPNRDERSIADAIEEIARDPATAAAKTARGLEAVRPFAWEAIAQSAIDIFNRGIKKLPD